MNLNFDRPRSDRISTEDIITELKQVAKQFKNRKFTRHEFDSVSTACKGTIVLQRFRTWDAALKATGLSLTPYRKPRKDQIPEEELLSELARVWESLGHRPSKTEWDNSDAKYSYTTYKSRFGGWVNACKVLISQLPATDSNSKVREKVSVKPPKAIPKEKSRNVPLKMRLAILKRDHYKCVLCGRSPSSHPGVSLHLDHIIPYSDGGKTTKGNLQTLCNDCNWGKGNDAEAI
jgi:5-methylcytosine-specific restriction endonuclease McrA